MLWSRTRTTSGSNSLDPKVAKATERRTRIQRRRGRRAARAGGRGMGSVRVQSWRSRTHEG
eukprot:762021-Hanusia_phi.AAC.5